MSQTRAVCGTIAVLTVIVLLMPGKHGCLVAADKPARRLHAHHPRRVLYNLDGSSCMFTRAGSKEPVAITVDDLKRLVGEIAYEGSQMDTLLVCVNAQVMFYPTRVGTMRGSRATAEERQHWPASERQWFENVQQFFAAGIDPYAVVLAEAKRKGLEALLTFRMNDAHEGDSLRAQFWTDHPESRAGYKDKGLDFGSPAVRDYVFSLIQEAVQRYDCDGVELDFQRFPAYFKDGSIVDRIARMNGLVERVRRMLDQEGAKRGRPLVLGVRVPSNYGAAPPTYEVSRQIGCDPVAWVREGWVDFLTVSNFLLQAADPPVAAWKELITSIPIYGGIECAAPPGGIKAYLARDGYRQAARRLWDQGADGIYLFNFFTTREHGANAWEPPFDLLSEIGEASSLLRRKE